MLQKVKDRIKKRFESPVGEKVVQAAKDGGMAAAATGKFVWSLILVGKEVAKKRVQEHENVNAAVGRRPPRFQWNQ